MLHHFQCHVCLQYACFVVGLYLCVLVCEPIYMYACIQAYISLLMSTRRLNGALVEG